MNITSRLPSLIDRLTFDLAAARKFANENRCALCLRSLMVEKLDGDQYGTSCTGCGPTYSHNYVGASTANVVKNEQRMAGHELAKPKTGRTDAEILKELGYD